MESFDYRKVMDTTDEVPWSSRPPSAGVRDAEDGGGWSPGVNWSPGIINPFRELGGFGQSLDTILSAARRRDEPVIFVLHVACPRVEYTDRGKSAVVVRS